ncbi:MAG: hypothetical protein LBV46_01500, partial [Bacteroidales bacterium]|nr:hypothetical protein [Bacteroidales bacterium]
MILQIIKTIKCNNTLYCLLMSIGILMMGTVYGQNEKKLDYFLEGGIRYGSTIYHPKSDTYLKDLYFGSLELRFGKQTTGTNKWERPLNFPIIGITLRYTDYSDFWDSKAVRKWQNSILGKNIAVFGYLQG